MAERRCAPAALVWLAPVLAGCLTLGPFVVRQNATTEWANYLWLVEQQAANIRAAGRPSFFLHTDAFGVFYPQFAFYGMALWSVAGGLAVVLGSAFAAFVAVLVAAYAAAYVATWWLARQVGLGRVAAHAPALVVALSPYLVGSLYARGDWAEIVATSMLPVVAAAGLHLARSARVRPGSIVALAGSTAVIAGSHPLTLVWGTLTLTGAGGVSVALAGRARPAGGRLALVLAVAIAGVALNAFSVLPAIVFRGGTVASSELSTIQTQGADHLGLLLSPYPRQPAGALDQAIQLPVYALAWALAALAVGRRRGSGRAAAALGTALTLLGFLMLDGGAWGHLPRTLRIIQFPWRLESYAVLVIAGLVVVGLRAARGRGWALTLAGALAAQAAFAGSVSLTEHGSLLTPARDVAVHKVPGAFSRDQQNHFRRTNDRLVRRIYERVVFPASAARRPPLHLEAIPGGQRISTNIVDSPFIATRGYASIVGRDPGGFVILRLTRPKRDDATVVVTVVHRTTFWPFGAGRLLSLLALLGLVAAVALSARRPRRTGRRSGAASRGRVRRPGGRGTPRRATGPTGR